MQSNSVTRSVSTVLLLLATTFCLAGCQSSLTTQTDAIERRIVDDTCKRAWLVTTYSSRDTSETQLGNRANNARRDAYCKG